MKLIGRILIILLAVALVAGVSYVIVNATNAGQPGAFGREGFRPNGDFNGQGFNLGQRPGGFGERDGFRGGRGERGGIFNVGNLLRTLLPIALIVTVFVLGERLVEKLRMRRLTKVNQ
jgi:hypothetical protein